MPSCICSACNHLNSVSCTKCACCSYDRFACIGKPDQVSLVD